MFEKFFQDQIRLKTLLRYCYYSYCFMLLVQRNDSTKKIPLNSEMGFDY